MTEEERYELRPIIEREALAFAVSQVSNEMIDKINILKAAMLAMHRALDELKQKPQLIIVDGNYFIKYRRIPHQCIVEGDAKFASIAAASVLAKTYRDDYMKNLHESFPNYNWKNNKGYATREHRSAISQFGFCHHHRMSFRLLPEELRNELFTEEQMGAI